LISTGLVTFRKVYFVPARAGLVAVAALQRRNVQTGTAILNFEVLDLWVFTIITLLICDSFPFNL